MPLPSIVLTGTVVSEPILRFTGQGDPVATIRVAANERRKTDAGEWETVSSVYLDVVVWRKAEEVTNACPKGTRVLVHGNLRSRSYTAKDGNERITFEVQALEMAPLVMPPHVYGGNDTNAQTWTNPIGESPF